eukprot:3375276-Pyramimonas_sp.AAC.1
MTVSSRGRRGQSSYARSPDRWATQSHDDARLKHDDRPGRHGAFNHGKWAPFSKNPLATHMPKKSDGSKMYKAPLRTIDARCPRERDGAFASRMQRELGGMFSDLRAAS